MVHRDGNVVAYRACPDDSSVKIKSFGALQP